MRLVYDEEDKSLQFSRKRETDIKGNSRVIFPGEGKDLSRESVLEMVRVELLGEFRTYVENKCSKKGEQASNLNAAEKRGLKSLKKRIQDSEIVVLPTDKSGRFAIITRKTYERAGEKHTSKDKEVSFEDIRETQKEINGNISMLIKFFKLGNVWNQTDRVRETMINKNLVLCPMYLLYKDHKGWEMKMETVPPTRPVASGNQGMNLHLSEIISETLEPVVDSYRGGFEVISTEDLIAKLSELNRSLEGWEKNKWWEGVIEGRYMTCYKCEGSEKYIFDENKPELCSCTSEDGSKEYQEVGKEKVTINFMKEYRKSTWSIIQELEQGKKLKSGEVPPE